MALVTLNYWAGARAAAGTSAETVEAVSIGAALEVAAGRRSDPRFLRVVRASSLLVDGASVHGADLDEPLRGPVEVEVLPPFAGG
jgi:molybdopterin converting factor small subunit